MIIANNVRPGAENNKYFVRDPAAVGEDNYSWLKRITEEKNFKPSGLLLLGGNSVVDFHIRVSQSPLRHDLTPSYWSQVGILEDLENFYSVPLQWKGDLSEMPHANGIQSNSLVEDYNDPESFPNIAFIQFTKDMGKILEYAAKLKWQRGFIDLPALVVRWLDYVWAVGAINPLAEAKGLPSAVFAEVAYGMGGIELTPGLATGASCPEAIWQGAKWWGEYYEGAPRIKAKSRAAPMVPKGCFCLRQPAAAVREEAYVPPEEKKPAAKQKK
jgi:hypothetical protein